MKNMKSKLFLLSLLSFLVACDDSNDAQTPPGSSIDIVSGDVEWEVVRAEDENGNCLYYENKYQDHPVVVTVTDSQGRALGGVDITFSLSFTGNTTGFFPVFELYEDLNGNGIPDGGMELVSDETDPLFKTETDSFTGSKTMIIRMNLSCDYKGLLTVFGAGMATSANYIVTAGDTVVVTE